MKKYIACLFLVIFTCSILAGCSWIGKTAGSAQAAVENSANATVDGYNKGYDEEKEK